MAVTVYGNDETGTEYSMEFSEATAVDIQAGVLRVSYQQDNGTIVYLGGVADGVWTYYRISLPTSPPDPA